LEESIPKFRNEVYKFAYLLSEETKEELGLLTKSVIFLQDPYVAQKIPSMGPNSVYLDWEPGFSDGPTSERIAVVDYDVDSNKLVKPAAKWDDKKRCFIGGDNLPIDVSTESACFRQVNVWAIVHDTLSLFQHPKVMGRFIPWAFEGNRIIVVPNAGYASNALYDRSSKSLQFYRFGYEPNEMYTCLSHDIVAHETGHAILDGIRPFYNEISSIQTSSFHEFLADITSIITALRFNEVRYEVVLQTGGNLDKVNFVGDLAEILGEYNGELFEGELQTRSYLRTAHNNLTMSYLNNNWSCHDCSKVLTGALYEILSKITRKQMELQDLIRKQIALKDEKEKANSVVEVLWEAITHFTRIALRALDFCPPVDIQFIDYAKALLRADEIAFPVDALNYRKIIREVFHNRGICECEDTGSACNLETSKQPLNREINWFDIDRISSSTTAAYHFLNLNRDIFEIPENQDFAVVDLYDTNKQVSCGISLPKEIVLEYIWREDVLLEGKDFGNYEGEYAQLLCGGTIVFDDRGNILYFVQKPGVENKKHKKEGERRRNNLLKFIENLVRGDMVGVAQSEDQAGLGFWRPAVEVTRRERSLLFEATPGFRYHPREVY